MFITEFAAITNHSRAGSYAPNVAPRPSFAQHPNQRWPVMSRHFTDACAYMRICFSCMRIFTRAALSMFNPALCGLTERSRIGAVCSGVCWTGTGAMTARSGGVRAWSAPPGGTFLTSTWGISRLAGSRSPALARSTPSAGRWGFLWRLGSTRGQSTHAADLASVTSEGGALLGRTCG